MAKAQMAQARRAKKGNKNPCKYNISFHYNRQILYEWLRVDEVVTLNYFIVS
jgi:hypothetical protein